MQKNGVYCQLVGRCDSGSLMTKFEKRATERKVKTDQYPVDEILFICGRQVIISYYNNPNDGVGFILDDINRQISMQGADKEKLVDQFIGNCLNQII